MPLPDSLVYPMYTLANCLEEVQIQLAEILADACDEMEADPDFVPRDGMMSAMFEDADPETDNLRSLVLELMKALYDYADDNGWPLLQQVQAAQAKRHEAA